MPIDATQRLHRTQCVALVRRNLHAARRSNDFTFFKILQAHALVDGTDHRRTLLRVDISQQRDMADHAIDKTANSAAQLIQTQPIHCQDAVANTWVTGTTIIADAVCVCLNQMEQIDDSMDDFTPISALRGIFSLMERSQLPSPEAPARNLSVSSAAGSEGGASFRSRASSTASALGLIKRAFSHSHMLLPNGSRSYRASSMSLPDSNPRGLRASMSAACPTKMSSYSDHQNTILTTIPPTPSVQECTPVRDAGMSPSPSPTDLMQIESLDPLYAPPMDDILKMPVPLTLRRLSESFSLSPSLAIAV
ncbi:hypothetical protein K458DRAFT_447551 [Lentithecium fluviatile CBS 122367]|uniref:Uncharacterized protein n=1 Tax=Lentithecium fluviatile CBS 122367 TaxID=1168545 RepID=A0A6G1IEA7_9PLEO|nr:hypothetical protein K458DRAFT_447551 [Lentithecium fluviatile CBS 122367]